MTIQLREWSSNARKLFSVFFFIACGTFWKWHRNSRLPVKQAFWLLVKRAFPVFEANQGLAGAGEASPPARLRPSSNPRLKENGRMLPIPSLH